MVCKLDTPHVEEAAAVGANVSSPCVAVAAGHVVKLGAGLEMVDWNLGQCSRSLLDCWLCLGCKYARPARPHQG